MLQKTQKTPVSLSLIKRMKKRDSKKERKEKLFVIVPHAQEEAANKEKSTKSTFKRPRETPHPNSRH